MGKVGSTSIRDSLQRLDLDVPIHHPHLLNPVSIENRKANIFRTFPEASTLRFKENFSQLLYNEEISQEIMRAPTGSRWRLISVVRDPVARNISAFFQTIDRRLPEVWRMIRSGSGVDIDGLVTSFIDLEDHGLPLRWFDTEIEQIFEIDVYASTFPHDQGHRTYSSARADLLVIKFEAMSSCGAHAIRDFLGISSFELEPSNVSRQKEYSAAYRSFLQEASIPDEYLRRMYNSKYANHFYTGDEIRGFYRTHRRV